MNNKTITIVTGLLVAVGAGLVWLVLGCSPHSAAPEEIRSEITSSQTPPASSPAPSQNVIKSPSSESTKAAERTIPMAVWKSAEAGFQKENLSATCKRYADSAAKPGGNGLSAQTAFQTIEQAVQNLASQKPNKSKGCEIVRTGSGAKDFTDFVENDIKNEFELFCTDDPGKNGATFQLMKKDYLDATMVQKEYEWIVMQRQANRKTDGPVHSHCKASLYEEDKPTQIVFKDGQFSAFAVVKFETPTDSLDEKGERIVTEGLTGVVYHLRSESGRFFIVEKIRAPFLPAPEDTEYTPRFP